MDAAAEEMGSGGGRSDPGSSQWRPRGGAFRPYGAAMGPATAEVVRHAAGSDNYKRSNDRLRVIVKKTVSSPSLIIHCGFA